MKAISALIYSKHIGIRILRHTLFWAADIVSYLSIVTANGEIKAVEVYTILLRTIPLALTTYFVLYYLIPSFSKQNDKGRLILWILAVIVFIGIGMRYFNFYVVNPLLNIQPPANFTFFDFPIIVRNIFSCMSVICMAATIKLVKNKTDLQLRNEQLEDEKKSAELNFLKAQMKPHFLFNTLNTLYSETIQESGKAQQVILHLSNLLRFILDECNKSVIPVGHEMRVIKDFVALEELRHGSRLQVNMRIENLDESIMISPLVFLPFVENSFKHTLSHNRGPINITIEIGMRNNQLSLLVENDRLNGAKRLNGYLSGKGLVNTKRQLDLLYGKEYELLINDQTDTYRVLLTVPVKYSSQHD